MGDFDALRPFGRAEALVLSLDLDGEDERDKERDRCGGSYGRKVRYSTEMISWYPCVHRAISHFSKQSIPLYPLENS